MVGGAGSDVFQFLAGFGSDVIADFNPATGQDLIDISGLSITAANFRTSVNIAASGANTLITIGTGKILLDNVASTSVTINTFHLAP